MHRLRALLCLALLGACSPEKEAPLPLRREAFETDAAAAVVVRLLEESGEALDKPSAPHCLILGEIRSGEAATGASDAFVDQIRELRSNWVPETGLELDPVTKAVVVSSTRELPVILQLSAVEETGPDSQSITGAWSWQTQMVRKRYDVARDSATSVWSVVSSTPLEKLP